MQTAKLFGFVTEIFGFFITKVEDDKNLFVKTFSEGKISTLRSSNICQTLYHYKLTYKSYQRGGKSSATTESQIKLLTNF